MHGKPYLIPILILLLLFIIFLPLFQGVLLLKSRVVPAGQAGTQKIVRLWIHEMYREFYDKLVEDSDRQFFFQTVKVCLF